MAMTVVCHDVALHVVNARRHHDQSAIEGLIKSRLRALSRYEPKVVQLLKLARERCLEDHVEI